MNGLSLRIMSSALKFQKFELKANSKKIRILGIDPGSQITGYGIVEKQGSCLVHIDNGGIFTRPKDPFSKKLQTLFQGVIELIDQFSPHAVAIENIFYAKNIKSSFQLGHARGALMVAAAEKGCRIFEYTPLTVKQALVGYGRASKEQVQSMVKQVLHLPEATYADASDALAVAVCHLNSVRWNEKVNTLLG